MPAKIQVDQNLWFLYICLQNSDYKSIDFKAVAGAANLKAPAARMRYSRLSRAIQNGTITSMQRTPAQGGSKKTVETQKKSKRTAETINEDDIGTRERRGIVNPPINTQLPNSYTTDNDTEDDVVEIDEHWNICKKVKVLEEVIHHSMSPISMGFNIGKHRQHGQSHGNTDSEIDGAKNSDNEASATVGNGETPFDHAEPKFKREDFLQIEDE